MTVIIWCMGAIEYSRQLGTLLCQQPGQLFVHGFQVIKIKQPSPNTGLVGRHDYAVTGPVKPGYGIYTSGQRYPFIDSLDVIVGVLIDNTIPVEDYQLGHYLAGTNREISAMFRNNA